MEHLLKASLLALGIVAIAIIGHMASNPRRLPDGRLHSPMPPLAAVFAVCAVAATVIVGINL